MRGNKTLILLELNFIFQGQLPLNSPRMFDRLYFRFKMTQCVVDSLFLFMDWHVKQVMRRNPIG